MLKNYPPLTLYTSMVILAIGMMSSTDSWMVTWIALEISLIGFIPIFSMDEKMTGQALSSYFLIQASGSTMYIVANLLTIQPAGELVLQLGLIMKLGLFPFHQWVPLCVNSMTWEGAIILLTLQKAPILMLIYNIQEDVQELETMAILSMGPTAILALNQVTLRNLMAYSSIMHASWLVMAIMDSPEVIVIYALYYFGITFILFVALSLAEEETNKKNISATKVQQQAMLLLILAGMPPFSIFILKVVILINIPDLWKVVYMLISTFVAGYYYFSILTPKMIEMIFNRENQVVFLGLLVNSSPALLLFF